jgi:hypothetical protein
MGKLGEFGQPLIRKQAERMVAEFASNVAAYFAREAGDALAQGDSTKAAFPPSASGTIGLAAVSPPTARKVPPFPWAGAAAGLSLGILWVALGHTGLGFTQVAQSLNPVPRTALQAAVTAVLAWIGAGAERALRRPRREAVTDASTLPG